MIGRSSFQVMVRIPSGDCTASTTTPFTCTMCHTRYRYGPPYGLLLRYQSVGLAIVASWVKSTGAGAGTALVTVAGTTFVVAWLATMVPVASTTSVVTV